jgi:hypothetical protein
VVACTCPRALSFCTARLFESCCVPALCPCYIILLLTILLSLLLPAHLTVVADDGCLAGGGVVRAASEPAAVQTDVDGGRL